MIRCCKHCGALLEDEAQVCDFCGAVLEAPKDIEPAPTETPVVEAPTQDVTEEAPTKKKLSKKTRIFLVCGIVLAVIAVIVAVNLLFFNPHIAVNKYEDVINGGFDKLESLAPQEYWDYMVKNSSTTADQYIAALAKAREESYLEQMSQDTIIGRPLGTKVQVLNTEKVTATEMAGIRNALEEEYGIDVDRVHTAYKLYLKVTQKGTKESASYVGMATAIRINSEWYLIRSVRRSEDTWRVTFLANAQVYELVTYYG